MIKNSNDIKFQEKNFYWGEVISIDENFHSGIIKVKVSELDNNIKNSDLAPCYPLFNFQFFNVLPKEGERVAIFLDRIYAGDKTINQEKRYWAAIGVSQPQNIDYDPYYYTSSSAESDGFIKPKNIKNIPESVGVMPNKNDVTIRGRKNTDIALKENQIIIRAGRHNDNEPLVFNELDPAFIQIKYKENTPESTKTKIIEQLQDIPSRFIIKTIESENSLQIKVIDKENKKTIDSFSKTYDNRNTLITEARANILMFQRKYERWELRTLLDELADMPVLFPNNKKIVKTLQTINNEDSLTIPSTINVVADFINLLSHKTNEHDLTDPISTIDKTTQNEINTKSYRMAKGEMLVEVLNLIRQIINNHVHPYANMKSVQDDLLKKLNNYNLESILNNNIRLG